MFFCEVFASAKTNKPQEELSLEIRLGWMNGFSFNKQLSRQVLVSGVES